MTNRYPFYLAIIVQILITVVIIIIIVNIIISYIIIIITINVSIMYIFDNDSGYSSMLTFFLMVLLTESNCWRFEYINKWLLFLNYNMLRIIIISSQMHTDFKITFLCT